MHKEGVVAIQFAVTALILMVIVWRKLDLGMHKFLLIMMLIAAYCAGAVAFR